jgi:hypothetical protein
MKHVALKHLALECVYQRPHLSRRTEGKSMQCLQTLGERKVDVGSGGLPIVTVLSKSTGIPRLWDFHLT